ncbi:hypothetical protein [Rufibacter roseus]|uniref:Uncharacterized protein n=1 Tax=Rufibacter roseus TaxID=1567108 RepID=A0ABW2DK75_9BACT|nr:hypothetical protein [Rufibacter roseus]
MLSQEKDTQDEHLIKGAQAQQEVNAGDVGGFQTGEQLEKSSFARLAQLKALYRQKLGFDPTLKFA